MGSSYVKHPLRDYVEAILNNDYFDETHSIQYGFGVRKKTQWIVFYDPGKEGLDFAFEPQFSDTNRHVIETFAEAEPREVSSAGLNKLGNRGEHTTYKEAFGQLWRFGSVGRFIDCVRTLELKGLLS